MIRIFMVFSPALTEWIHFSGDPGSERRASYVATIRIASVETRKGRSAWRTADLGQRKESAETDIRSQI